MTAVIHVYCYILYRNKYDNKQEGGQVEEHGGGNEKNFKELCQIDNVFDQEQLSIFESNW